jgi:uncharacterized protein (TIRG00374 family)
LKQRVILLLKVGVAIALITWLVAGKQLELAELSRVKERWPWLVLAQLPFGAVLLIAARRWQLLLRAQGIHYRFADMYSLTLIGWAFNQLLPGTLGGDVIKAYVVAREQPGRRSAAVISVLVDRVLGLFMLFAVALAGVLFNLRAVAESELLRALAWMMLGLFAGGLLATAAFYTRRVRDLRALRWILSRLPAQALLSRIDEAFYVYRSHPREVGACLALSVLLQLCVVSTNIFLALSLFSEPIPWESFFFLIPVAHVVMAVPISPAAVGTAEFAYTKLLALVGVPHGALISILQRATFVLWALLGCVVYIRRKGRVTSALEGARRNPQGAGVAGGEGDPPRASAGRAVEEEP